MKNPFTSAKSRPHRRRQSFRPQCEELETRFVPAVSLAYNVPADGLVHNLTVRFNPGTAKFEILDGTPVVASRTPNTTPDTTINGVNSQDEILTVQIPTGLMRPPVFFNGGLAGHDRIVV